MSDLALLLQILNGVNMATPSIVAVINSITKGREEGKTDEQIQEESMALALETKDITETDMGDQP